MIRHGQTGCPRPLQPGVHPRRQIWQADFLGLVMARSLEESWVLATRVRPPRPHTWARSSRRWLSRLEAEFQLGTIHRATTAPSSPIVRRATAKRQYELHQAPVLLLTKAIGASIGASDRCTAGS